MTELAHTRQFTVVRVRKSVSARKKCLGASTAVNRDIGDCLRSVEETGGTRVWLGVKKHSLGKGADAPGSS